MSARGRFLQRKPLPEARALLLDGVAVVDAEEVDADEACGRICAETIFALHPSPHYRASAMDGVAVRAADTFAASAQSPLRLRVATGADDSGAGPCCQPVDTGSLLPDWADAVLRIEDVKIDNGVCIIKNPTPPGNDVRRAGEDIDAGSLVVPASARLSPYDVGALLATGTSRVKVRRLPRVAILATGSEVVEPGARAGAGQVIEYNSRVLAALVRDWGGQPHRLGIVADDEASLAAAVDEACRSYDVVCVIAGSSAGRKDFTIPVLEDLGDVFVHGVDIAPGRPVALARIGAAAVVAVPGYPVSAIVACEQLLRPLLAALLGGAERRPPTVDASVTRKIPSRLGLEEFRRVCLTRGSGGYVVAPLPGGAGSISTVAGAHGWLRIGPDCEGIDAGATVSVELLVTRDEVDAALVVAGSPSQAGADIERSLRSIDVRARVHYLRLAEIDAVAALTRGEAHLAFSDSEAGTDGVGGDVAPLTEVRLCGSDLASRLWATSSGLRESPALVSLLRASILTAL